MLTKERECDKISSCSLETEYRRLRQENKSENQAPNPLARKIFKVLRGEYNRQTIQNHDAVDEYRWLSREFTPVECYIKCQ